MIYFVIASYMSHIFIFKNNSFLVYVKRHSVGRYIIVIIVFLLLIYSTYIYNIYILNQIWKRPTDQPIRCGIVCIMTVCCMFALWCRLTYAKIYTIAVAKS